MHCARYAAAVRRIGKILHPEARQVYALTTRPRLEDCEPRLSCSLLRLWLNSKHVLSTLAGPSLGVPATSPRLILGAGRLLLCLSLPLDTTVLYSGSPVRPACLLSPWPLAGASPRREGRPDNRGAVCLAAYRTGSNRYSHGWMWRPASIAVWYRYSIPLSPPQAGLER